MRSSGTLRSALAPAVFSVVAAVALYSEVWANLEGTGYGDYQEYHHLWEAARIAIERFGEWPLWDPFQCGGVTQYANPQTQVFHPLFYVSLLTGTTIGLKVFLTSHAAAGIWGTYTFVRHDEGRSFAASWMAALVWAGSGYFAWHCGTGHANFIAFYLTPWIMLGWRRSLVDLRWAVLVGLVMSSTVYAGGVYAFPFFVLLLAHQTVVALADPKHRAAVFPAGAVAVLVTVLVSAFRLAPILSDLGHNPRTTFSGDSMSFSELVDALTWRTTSVHSSIEGGHPWVWSEYSVYLGFAVVTLGLIGAVVVLRQPGRRWMVSGVLLFGLLTMGAFASWAPWTLLHRMPIYDSLKVPSRFGVIFGFFIVLLAARGLDAIVRKVRVARPRVAPWIAGGIALVAVVDVGSAHLAVLEDAWDQDPVARHRPLPFYLTAVPEPDDPSMGEDQHPAPIYYPELNVGTGYCYSGMSLHGARGLWAGRSDQVRLGAGGTLISEGTTANTVWATVELPQASTVEFNRNWAPEWESSFGRLRAGPFGLMVVDVTRGVHRIELRYAPRTLRPALALTCLGLVICLLCLRRRPRRRWVWLIASTLGTALGLLAYWAMIQSPTPVEASMPLHARASDWAERRLNEWYTPARAIDGDGLTEWHANGDGDWLEIRSDRELPVAWVRLLNARNAPHLDRSTARMRVIAWAGGELVHESEVDLPLRETRDGGWIDVHVGAPRVERIRFVVLEHRGRSGGLAEVELISLPDAYDEISELLVSTGDSRSLRDRRDATMWSPDEHDPERWVEARYQNAGRVEGVSVRTADAFDSRIELFRGEQRMGVVDHHVRGAPSSRWVHLPVHRGGVDRLRFWVGDAPVRISEIRTY